ncbi:RHS repeat-associated core domain-containing protein [Dyella nitratireducens]|uniref:Teneurin-like YD-shell domain-containing protein n=1 Tax=Dyella nitratireducens TaxID=1849580 RepID=A0ABQ1FII5_9GAMM|nr:RHS repeat-associated core domain-containing protein [Dyella nitratireducens]GGA16862.1 hypothetical protein GCM10010981_00720 [Dyella nitratireducens]GLQ44867.1 hypothetical protein GCM10007902_47170 [Dyella nitratireducens]
MITDKKQHSGKFIGTLLRWLALSLLFVGTHALAQSTGTVTYVYTDPQGTPLAEADASGNITATFDYTPYGTYAPQGTSTPGPAPKGPGYTGHVNDPETNLVYMQARYYDPATGHFLSTDPVRPRAGDAFNFNRYTYVDNNPIMGMDPTGMEDDCGPGCAAMRRLSNWFDGIGKGELSGGSGMPTRLYGQAGATLGYMNGEANQEIATATAAAAPVVDAIPGVTLGACATGASCGASDWIFGSLAVAPGDGEFLNLGRIGATGKIGEDALKVLGGSANEFFPTPFGARFVDRFAGGIINESKVGYVSLTSAVRRQIQKDAWLIQNNGRVQGGAWHFFQSPVTGRGGASAPVREALDKAGINVVEH